MFVIPTRIHLGGQIHWQRSALNNTSYRDLQIVDSKEKSEFTFILSVIKKNLGKRKGKIVILENKSNNVIFNTDWQKGSPSAFNGYSGTRGVIVKMMKRYILEEFPEIYADNN